MHAAFTPDTITEYGTRMPEITADHVGTWEEGQQFTLIDEMRVLTTHLLAETLLGVDIDGHEQTVLTASDALFRWGDFRRPGQALPSWVPTVARYRLNDALSDLNAYVADVLAESSPGDDTVSAALLNAHESGLLSIKQVKDNLTGLLMAGHESSAVTLTMAWYELSRHQEILAQLTAEVEAVANDGLPSIHDYDELTVTSNVIKETLRLYPPVWSVNRQTITDVELGGYQLSEGTQLMLPQWAVHRDDRYWENPTSFDPSRWEKDVDRPEYAFYPFSGGRRHCIGLRFARIELVIALATMARQVELTTTADEPPSFVPSITIRPETPITATVTQIHQ
jgi:cytochrome P450